MEYRTGSIGRVLTIRFDHGEDFLATSLSRDKN